MVSLFCSQYALRDYSTEFQIKGVDSYFSSFFSANRRMFLMVVSCPSMIFKRSFLSVSNDAVRDVTSFFRAASSAVRVSALSF